MKKLSQIIVLTVGVALLLCACSKGRQPGSGEDSNDTQGGISVDGQTLLDLETYSLKPQEGSDDNPHFQWRMVTMSDSGYYFWQKTGMIKFFDISSGLLVPLCNRPDCSHTDKDCNAYFEPVLTAADDVDDTFEISYIQFVGGHLYIIGVDKAGYVSLYKVAADGSAREKSMRLYKADFSDPSGDPSGREFQSPEVCIHRGYIYWINSTATPLCIHRMKLGGNKDEVIYTEDGDWANTYRLEGYGDFVFFQSGHLIDEGYHMDGGIYAYNIQTGEVRLVLDNAISSYMLEDDQIYYATEKGISVYDLTTGKSEPRVENGIAYSDISVDERYLYCYDGETDKLIVYKHDGAQVAEIADKEVIICSFGASGYLFSTRHPGVQADPVNDMAILSVDDIESGNAEWKNLK